MKKTSCAVDAGGADRAGRGREAPRDPWAWSEAVIVRVGSPR